MKKYLICILLLVMINQFVYGTVFTEYCDDYYYMGKINNLKNNCVFVELSFNFVSINDPCGTDGSTDEINAKVTELNTLKNETFIFYLSDGATSSMLAMLNTAFVNDKSVAFYYHTITVDGDAVNVIDELIIDQGL